MLGMARQVEILEIIGEMYSRIHGFTQVTELEHEL